MEYYDIKNRGKVRLNLFKKAWNKYATSTSGFFDMPLKQQNMVKDGFSVGFDKGVEAAVDMIALDFKPIETLDI